MPTEQIPNENASIPWRRIATESIAIILSILLAFAIDAGWETMKESKQEKVLLMSLLSDFKEIHNRINENTERHEKFIEIGIRLLSMDAIKAAKITPQDLDAMLGAMFLDFASLYLPSGSRDALFASGDIGIISNKQLRTKLAAWPSRVVDAAEDEEFIANDILNNLMPYIRRTVHTRNIAKETNTISTELIPGTDPVSYDALWNDLIFDNLVSTRILSETFSVRENVALKESAEDIIRIIEKELK